MSPFPIQRQDPVLVQTETSIEPQSTERIEDGQEIETESGPTDSARPNLDPDLHQIKRDRQ